MDLSEEEWRKKLTNEQFQVLREKGTERPFSGELCENKRAGKYYCAGCGAHLFDSETKYDSGSGWPSFTEGENMAYEEDYSLSLPRIEVHCAKCGGHLGHVFEDGPPPTGKRYCINSIALKFKERE